MKPAWPSASAGSFRATAIPRGVGWQQDIRAILHACTTTAEAIDLLRRIPIRKAGYCAVLGDASGEVAIVEKVVGAVWFVVRAARWPMKRTWRIARKCSPTPTRTSAKMACGAWPSSPPCADEAQLDLSLHGMLELFSAHGDPVGICQHGPELHSNVGFFMLPQQREVHIVRGYTCRRNIEVVRF